jgi:uncharacterized peroxidase-related enzyme
MPRLKPLPPETTPELRSHFDFFLDTLGFTSNSVLTMQCKPQLVKAFAQLNAAVTAADGEVDLGFRRLIGHVDSKASGCLYCQAHTLLGAKNFGISEEKMAEGWAHTKSDLYSPTEKIALDFALAAASQPNAVADALFNELAEHWSESQIVEILGVVAMFGFLNRWNDSMATPLEHVLEVLATRVAGKHGFTKGKHF